MSVTVNFIFGNDRDIDPKRQYQGIVNIPHVGDHISLFSTRSDDGSYVHKDPQKVFIGTVTRVEHTIDEWGENASSYRLSQIIDVYLKPSNSRVLESD